MLTLVVALALGAASPWRVAYAQAGAIWSVGFDGEPPTKIVPKVTWERPLASSPDGSRLIYWDHAQGHWDLWMCGSDGRNPRNLTTDLPGGCRSAVFSPDGRAIAFMCDGPPGLYTMALDGSGKKRLSAEGHRDDPPVWSPDGKRLAFHSLTESGPNVFVADLATGEVSGVGRGSRPQWTPDGRALLFGRTEGVSRLALDGRTSSTDLATGKETEVGRYGRNLALFAATPDGRTWAAYGNGTLWWSSGSQRGELRLPEVGGIALVRG